MQPLDSTWPEFIMPVDSDAELYRAVVAAAGSSRSDPEQSETAPLRLSTNDGSDEVELPADLVDGLFLAASAFAEGRAVSIISVPEIITTFQAAELLGLRHAEVVELLDAGELTPVASGATRPRLRLADVLALRDELHERQSQSIAETSELE